MFEYICRLYFFNLRLNDVSYYSMNHINTECVGRILHPSLIWYAGKSLDRNNSWRLLQIYYMCVFEGKEYIFYTRFMKNLILPLNHIFTSFAFGNYQSINYLGFRQHNKHKKQLIGNTLSNFSKCIHLGVQVKVYLDSDILSMNIIIQYR